MVNNCPKCGLPLEICACKAIEKGLGKIKITVEARKFGKIVTLIEGLPKDKELLSTLKRRLACGGTYKDNKIELQGNHKNKLKKILVEIGYNEENIED